MLQPLLITALAPEMQILLQRDHYPDLYLSIDTIIDRANYRRFSSVMFTLRISLRSLQKHHLNGRLSSIRHP